MKNKFTKYKNIGFKAIFFMSWMKLISIIKVSIYKYLYSNNRAISDNVRVNQPTQFIGRGKITIGSAQLGVWPSPGFIDKVGYIEARNLGSEVIIGASTYINNSFVIIADKTTIEIGNNCLIGPNFFVCDSDFHGLELDARASGKYICLSVKIFDNVFIGEGVKILKGVTVGEGSVIGSGSIVVKDVDAFSVYAGNPARKIRELKSINN